MSLVKKDLVANPCTIRTFFGNAVRGRFQTIDTLEELLEKHNIPYFIENNTVYISSSDFSLVKELYHQLPGIGQVSKIIH